MAVQSNKAALQRAVDRWNAGDLDGYLQLYDPGCTLHSPLGDLPAIEAIDQFYRAFWAAFPGSRLQIEEAIGEGDEVACRFSVRGTQRGEFMGIPPTGKDVAMSGITILRFADEKCVERWNEADFLGLLQQLGVAPTSG